MSFFDKLIKYKNIFKNDNITKFILNLENNKSEFFNKALRIIIIFIFDNMLTKINNKDIMDDNYTDDNNEINKNIIDDNNEINKNIIDDNNEINKNIIDDNNEIDKNIINHFNIENDLNIIIPFINDNQAEFLIDKLKKDILDIEKNIENIIYYINNKMSKYNKKNTYDNKLKKNILDIEKKIDKISYYINNNGKRKYDRKNNYDNKENNSKRPKK